MPSAPASVQIDWTFSDGNGGSQGSGGPASVLGHVTVAIAVVAVNHLWSALAHADSIAFDPVHDTLTLDHAAISASTACAADTQCSVALTLRPSGASPPRVAGS